MLDFAKHLPLHLRLIKALKYLYIVPHFGFFTVMLSEKLRNRIAKHTSSQNVEYSLVFWMSNLLQVAITNDYVCFQKLNLKRRSSLVFVKI